MDDTTKKDTKTQEADFFYVLKKVERISSVNTILSSELANESVFKDTLSHKTMSLYEAALALSIGRSHLIEDSVARVRDQLYALQSLYEIARHGRLFSNENCLLMLEECFALDSYLAEQLNIISGKENNGGQRIARSMMEITPEEVAQGYRRPDGHQLTSQGPQSPHLANEPHFKRTEKKDDFYNVFYDKSLKNGSENDAKLKGQNQPSTPKVASRHKDRRAQILSILQKRDKISIKDVSSEITDCSEKTIQRELAALVESGVLKKEGERRWSTYSLA